MDKALTISTVSKTKTRRSISAEGGIYGEFTQIIEDGKNFAMVSWPVLFDQRRLAIDKYCKFSTCYRSKDRSLAGENRRSAVDGFRFGVGSGGVSQSVQSRNRGSGNRQCFCASRDWIGLLVSWKHLGSISLGCSCRSFFDCRLVIFLATNAEPRMIGVECVATPAKSWRCD